MPPYPNETIFCEVYSLGQFVAHAQQLLDDELVLPFIRFVLGGRKVDHLDEDDMGLNPTIHRVAVDPRLELGAPSSGQVQFTRDYDSIIGCTRSFPLTVPIDIWVVPPFSETLTSNVFLTRDIMFQDVCALSVLHAVVACTL
jgi:hypothetical protein